MQKTSKQNKRRRRGTRLHNDRNPSWLSALLLVGLLSVAQMQVMTIITNSTANQRTTAITLAQDQMEILGRRPYANIETPPLSDTSGIYTRSWVVQTNTPATNMKQVTVTVSWPGETGASAEYHCSRESLNFINIGKQGFSFRKICFVIFNPL